MENNVHLPRFAKSPVPPLINRSVPGRQNGLVDFFSGGAARNVWISPRGRIMASKMSKSCCGVVDESTLCRYSATILFQSMCLCSNDMYCSAKVCVKTSKFCGGVFAVG